MGAEISNQTYSKELAIKTQRLAIQRAKELQRLADDGKFDRGQRTMDIEQESFVLDSTSGSPVNVESLILNNSLGIRPESTIYTIEYDANGITPVSEPGITHALDGFQSRTKKIQKVITDVTGGKGMVVNIGVAPLVGSEWIDLLISEPNKKRRYDALEDATFNRENEIKKMIIANPKTSELLEDRASNLSGMTRTAATQLHLAYPTLKETLEAYNISIALAGPMIAMLSNSPYAGGIDTGLVSARMELLAQSEQKRGVMAQPTNSLLEHFTKTVLSCLPPFIETEDHAKALDLTYGGMHISTRIRVDEQLGTSRVELRVIDSLDPCRAIQALVFSIGVMESLRGQSLPTYQESIANYKAGRKGLSAIMYINGRAVTAQKLIVELLEASKTGLNLVGLSNLKRKFLKPLEDEIKRGKTQADRIREQVQNFEKQGASRREALIRILKDLNISLMS